MSRLLSDRAEKTANVVLLPAVAGGPADDSARTRHRIVLLSACGSIFAFFTALIVAYVWRAQTPPYWDPIPFQGRCGSRQRLILAQQRHV